MPGFLSLFDQTERVVLSPPGSPREYWVEIKHYLTGEEDDEVTAATFGVQGMEMTTIAGMDEQQIRARMDIVGQARTLLLHSIVNWNLTDRDDEPLPLAPRDDKERAVASLPGGVRDIITARITEIRKAQKKTPNERAIFRGAAAGSDHDGDAPAAGADRVPDGGRVLEAPRPPQV